MLFSSLTFLLLFLPTTIILYFLSNQRIYRNIVLLLASLVFYAWGEPIFILYMIALVTFDYYIAIYLNYLKTINKVKTAHWFFIISIIINLSGLIFFKYINFVFYNLSLLFHFKTIHLDITLPLGISFYTFQILSYVIDAYFDRVDVQRKWYLLLTYLSLFPQLIAGPIVRYQTIQDELENRIETWNQVYEGLERFIFGLGKKVIIANNVAIVANYVFNLPYDQLSFSIAWLGAISFTFQIYFDFNAYSDMAIGIGKIFGFHFLENFNYPYVASSITDFWHRWHISLSTWFRDYLYIPLGGNRVSQSRWLLNILIVWFLTGLWHGASWNFVLWGLYFGLILVIEKLFLLKLLKKLPIINHVYVILIIIISWVIFNTNDFSHLSDFIKAMFQFSTKLDFISLQDSNIINVWPFFMIGLFGSTPLFRNIVNHLNKSFIGQLFIILFSILVLALSIVYLVNDTFNPFIYFRF